MSFQRDLSSGNISNLEKTINFSAKKYLKLHDEFSTVIKMLSSP